MPSLSQIFTYVSIKPSDIKSSDIKLPPMVPNPKECVPFHKNMETIIYTAMIYDPYLLFNGPEPVFSVECLGLTDYGKKKKLIESTNSLFVKKCNSQRLQYWHQLERSEET